MSYILVEMICKIHLMMISNIQDKLAFLQEKRSNEIFW